MHQRKWMMAIFSDFQSTNSNKKPSLVNEQVNLIMFELFLIFDLYTFNIPNVKSSFELNLSNSYHKHRSKNSTQIEWAILFDSSYKTPRLSQGLNKNPYNHENLYITVGTEIDYVRINF